jgi:hypothetical protein
MCFTRDLLESLQGNGMDMDGRSVGSGRHIAAALKGALQGVPLPANTSQAVALKEELVRAALVAAENSSALIRHC